MKVFLVVFKYTLRYLFNSIHTEFRLKHGRGKAGLWKQNI